MDRLVSAGPAHAKVFHSGSAYFSFHLLRSTASVSWGSITCQKQNEALTVWKRTWMFVLEFGQVVYVFVDNDPEVLGLVVRRHVVFAECLGHGDDKTSALKQTE